MELFIPGLILVIFCALVTFVIIPRVNPMILAVISLVALIAAGVHHYSLFSAEYRLSTWQYALASYTPFIVLGLGILFVIAALYYLVATPFTTKNNSATPLSPVQNMFQQVTSPITQAANEVVNSIKNMPPASTATNPITAGINTAVNTVANYIPGLGPAPAPAPAKSPIIPGLGFRASEI